MLKRFSKKGAEKGTIIEGNDNNLIITKCKDSLFGGDVHFLLHDKK